MFGNNRISDKQLIKQVNKKLMRGGGEAQLSAAVRQGTVTVSGTIRYEAQRRPILKGLSSIAGVRRVVDQIQLKPRAVS